MRKSVTSEGKKVRKLIFLKLVLKNGDFGFVNRSIDLVFGQKVRDT